MKVGKGLDCLRQLAFLSLQGALRAITYKHVEWHATERFLIVLDVSKHLFNSLHTYQLYCRLEVASLAVRS